MAVSQDDKLMGEKAHYYCSSSEDEDDDKPGPADAGGPDGETRGQGGTSANTGPKGVIEDWRRFKQLENENRKEQEKEKVAMAKKLSLTCRSDREDQEAKEKEQKLDEELEALLDDEVLAEFMQRRMREMMLQTASTNKVFGCLLDLHDADQFLNAVDKEAKEVVVVVFIYENEIKSCEAMTGCLRIICKDYPSVKFCRILASTAGLSKHFKSDGVPALLVYRGGELTSSFVRVTDALGEDFYASDVESFLIENAVLVDKDLVPSIIRDSKPDDDDDSD